MDILTYRNPTFRDVTITVEPDGLVITALALVEGRLKSVDIKYTSANAAMLLTSLDNIFMNSSIRGSISPLNDKTREAYGVIVDFKKRTGRISPTYTYVLDEAAPQENGKPRRHYTNLSAVQGSVEPTLRTFLGNIEDNPLTMDNVKEISKYMSRDQLDILRLATKETSSTVIESAFIHRILYRSVAAYIDSADPAVKNAALETIQYSISLIAEFEPPKKVWELASRMDSTLFNLLFLHYGGDNIRNIDHYSQIDWNAHTARQILVPLSYGTEQDIYTEEYRNKVLDLLSTDRFVVRKGYDVNGNGLNNLANCKFTFIASFIEKTQRTPVVNTFKLDLSITRFLELYDHPEILPSLRKFLKKNYTVEIPATADAPRSDESVMNVLDWTDPWVGDNDTLFIMAVLKKDVEWLTKYSKLSNYTSFMVDLFASHLVPGEHEYSLPHVLHDLPRGIYHIFMDGRFPYNLTAIDNVLEFIHQSYKFYNKSILLSFFKSVPLPVLLSSKFFFIEYLVDMAFLSGDSGPLGSAKPLYLQDKFIEESYTVNDTFLRLMSSIITKVDKTALPFHLLVKLSS